MKSVQKKLLLLVVLSLSLFSFIFSILLYSKNLEIEETLKEQIKHLHISYKQGLDRFEFISKNVYNSFQNDTVFLEILSAAVNATKEEKEKLNKQLYNHLKDEYEKLRLLEVMQLQVMLPNNESFIRMHAPDKFGDDLTDIRYSVKEANSHKIAMFGFEQGRDNHAFRHIYPIYREGKHIGVIDISFSSTMLQNYTMRASEIHTHFIINRNVFKSQAWKSNIQEPYDQSIEHDDFMFSMSDHMNHQRLKESHLSVIEPLHAVIDKSIDNGKEFAIYKEVGDIVRVVSFLPVRNVKNDKTVAYFVSYVESPYIKAVIRNFKLSVLATALIILIIMIISWRVIVHGELLKKELQYDELTKVFNRKYFFKVAQEQFEKSKRFSHPFSIVMVDIDHFKLINDTHGHQSGDIVLQEISKILSSSMRKFDIVARYGGEEFILLILANADNSCGVVEGIRQKIEEHSFCKSLNLKVTASFGIAGFNDDASLEEIIKRADSALYSSKDEGRNRVTIS
jgi:diguanylate cyclase (GGDEF)-like protein